MQAFDRIRQKCNQIVMKPRFHVPSMTENRLPTSSIAIAANTSFHFHAADWYTRRRRSDEYDSGATPGRSTSPAVGEAAITWRRPSTAATTGGLSPVTVQRTVTAAGNCTGASGHCAEQCLPQIQHKVG